MEQEIREALAKASDIYQVYERDEEHEETFHQTNLIGSNGDWEDDIEIPSVEDAHLLGYAKKYLEWCLSQIAELRDENQRLRMDRKKDEEEFRPRFKMDANGNLTRLRE